MLGSVPVPKLPSLLNIGRLAERCRNKSEPVLILCGEDGGLGEAQSMRRL